MTDHTKHIVDWAAVGATIGTLAGFLPAIAALFSILWTVLRIVEMVTGKSIAELMGRK